jgi:Uma2 family endonuclease
MIICDPTDLDPLIKRRPSLVVEVLSDTTRMTDLREKLFAYHQIESLDAYLIVEQDERKVYRHWRDDERLWWSDTVSERGSIPIPRLGIELSLDDIYRKLPNPAPS